MTPKEKLVEKEKFFSDRIKLIKETLPFLIENAKLIPFFKKLYK